MLFKVFHRTLEFNLLLSITLITTSFLAFSISRTTLFLAALKDILSLIHGPPRDTIARSRVFRSPNTLETPRNETVYLIISSTDIFKTNRNLLNISSLAKKSEKKMTPVLQATLYSVSLSNSIGFTLH